jgi:hypothetical protein
VIVHAHLRDSTAERQQEALGVLGVNLIHCSDAVRGHDIDLLSDGEKEVLNIIGYLYRARDTCPSAARAA